jgi:gas vesicle protein
MGKFLVGFGFGLGVGILFAPMRGEAFRVVAAVRASEIADTARETYDKAQDTVQKVVTSIRGDEGEPRTGTEG